MREELFNMSVKEDWLYKLITTKEPVVGNEVYYDDDWLHLNMYGKLEIHNNRLQMLVCNHLHQVICKVILEETGVWVNYGPKSCEAYIDILPLGTTL